MKALRSRNEITTKKMRLDQLREKKSPLLAFIKLPLAWVGNAQLWDCWSVKFYHKSIPKRERGCESLLFPAILRGPRTRALGEARRKGLRIWTVPSLWRVPWDTLSLNSGSPFPSGGEEGDVRQGNENTALQWLLKNMFWCGNEGLLCVKGVEYEVVGDSCYTPGRTISYTFLPPLEF